MTKKIIITGASGFIGRFLTEKCIENNFEVIAFQRKKKESTHPNLQYVTYDLDKDLNDHFFKKADYLIHCAYKPLLNKNETDSNFIGTRKLIDQCRKHHVKIIFLSTVSAQTQIPSRYSASKIAIEQQLDTNLDVILKLGLVIGNGGLFEKISEFIKKSPFVPIFDKGQQNLQYISIYNIQEIIFSLLEKFQPGQYIIVKKESLQMKEFYLKLLKFHQKKKLVFNFSSHLTYWILKVTESLKIKLPISTENIIGLQKTKKIQQKLPENYTDSDILYIDDALAKLISNH